MTDKCLLTPVSSIFSNDVMKHPTLSEDIERNEDHLHFYFLFERKFIVIHH